MEALTKRDTIEIVLGLLAIVMIPYWIGYVVGWSEGSRWRRNNP